MKSEQHPEQRSPPGSHCSVTVTDFHGSPYRHTSDSLPNEQLRSRELLRYYTPLPPTSNTRTIHTQSLSDTPVNVEAPPSPISHGNLILKSSDDSALTAFAQLLALKLDCQRSMISLIDKEKQYIVTEATRTLSITDQFHQSGLPDGLWIGCETVPRESGLCVNTLALYPPETSSTPTTTTPPESFPLLEIQDLTLDPRFNTRDYVLNYPHLRFYAGTPLRTKRGYNIGSLCVVDAAPRVLSAEEKRTLGRMGMLVMRHLEMTADRRALKRNQRMAESLGRFVAGTDGRLEEDDEVVVAVGEGRREEMGKGVGVEPDASFSETHPGTLVKTFSRASILIRNALRADGVVFVDAETAFRIPPPPLMRNNSNAHVHQQRRRSEILGSCVVVQRRHEKEHLESDKVVADEAAQRKYPGIGAPPSETTIQRLLRLHPQGTVLSFAEEPSPPANEPIFDDTPLPHHPTPSSDQSQLYHEIRSFLPNSAAVLFLPLLHASGKPYAASFSWTLDAQRVFTEDESSYLQGFMSSIMAEVSQLQTLSADKAKGDFISSISHELRSPLHGVLASVELLAGTRLDGLQRGFIDTVESCGRTLLDTINHVLDFSKLNSLMRDRKTGKVGAKARGDGDDIWRGRQAAHYGGVVSLVEAIDLSDMTEQVIESVYTGYEFKSAHTPTFDGCVSPSLRDAAASGGLSSLCEKAEDGAAQPVGVILDIDKRDNWTFVTQPGALRRILMNIFGNALKYTDSGWIKIRLQAEDQPPCASGPANEHNSRITFTVSDTGRGIDREFLKTGLFTPFSQEDSLTAGTGLGMSIVRQIVQLLGGDIEVKSHVGVGTEVTVTLILPRFCQDNLAGSVDPFVEAKKNPSEPSSVQRAQQLAFGKTICLYGLEPPLHESLARYAREWYGMRIVTGSLYPESADVLLANESAELRQHRENMAKIPLIILCNNTFRYQAHLPAADKGNVPDFISNTCGPIKLGKALTFCLQRSSTAEDLTHAGASLSCSTSAAVGPNKVTKTKILHEAIHLLPRAPLASRPGSQPATQQPDLVPNVLIVEDNPINLMLLATFLKKRNYPFTQAENGLLGLQAVQAKPDNFDVILMDLQMPIMCGIEATRAIRDLEAMNVHTMKRSLIIALTGLAGNDNIAEAYDAGVDLFLTKPVSFKTVDRELERWKTNIKAAASAIPDI